MHSEFDVMTVRDMNFYGYHGVYPEENRLGQRFKVHFEGYFDAATAAKTDELADTANYGTIFEITKKIVENERYQLLETLSTRIAEVLLAEFPVFHRITIEVVKLQAPIPGFAGDVSVKITRGRQA